MRVDVIQHHKPAEVRDYLADALAIVAELEVEGALQSVAFAKAVDLLSAKTLNVAKVEPALALLGHPRQ